MFASEIGVREGCGGGDIALKHLKCELSILEWVRGEVYEHWVSGAA